MERRNTIQREMVYNAVINLSNHATADEIYALIIKDHPTIGKGTVYRNLNILAEEGAIRKVDIPDGPYRFDHILEEHYHVKCVKCGKLFDVDMEVLPDLKLIIDSSDGDGVQKMLPLEPFATTGTSSAAAVASDSTESAE